LFRRFVRIGPGNNIYGCSTRNNRDTGIYRVSHDHGSRHHNNVADHNNFRPANHNSASNHPRADNHGRSNNNRNAVWWQRWVAGRCRRPFVGRGRCRR